MIIKEILVLILLCENIEIFAVQMKYSNIDIGVVLLLNELQMQHPTILTSTKNTNLIRKLFSEDNFVKAIENVNPELSKSYQNPIIFVDGILSLQDLQSLLNDLKLALLIFQNNGPFDDAYQFLEIKIDQNIYFYKTASQELFESYQINNRDIKQKLGYIDQVTKIIVWLAEINSNFITRRSNFHGLILKG